MKNWIAAVGFSLLISFSFVLIIVIISHPVRGATTIYVDDDGGADYTKIQDAINAANNGDVIHVSKGTYYENVVVNELPHP